MKNKRRNIALILSAVLIISAALAVSELVRQRSYYLGEIPPAAGSTNDPRPSESPEVTKAPLLPEPEAVDEPAPTSSPAEKGGEALTLLLVGSDGRRGAEGALDALAAARYEKTEGTLKLIGFSRELYVEIPGYGWAALSRAYELGGMMLLSETVRHNFGIEFEGCLLVDYAGLSAVVDALGGVEVELTGEEAAFLGLAEGANRLNGDQALAYMAFEGGEESVRNQRRLALVRSLVEALEGQSDFGLIKIAFAALQHISSDMSRAELIAHALGIYRSGLRTIENYTLPLNGGTVGEKAEGISVVMTDMEESRRLIAEWFYGE